jgi:hypothetical protein
MAVQTGGRELMEWRQSARTGTIHIFPDGAKPSFDSKPGCDGDAPTMIPLCGVKGPGAWSVPLTVDDVDANNICSRCKDVYKAREEVGNAD